jgi:hypothetical protein
MPFATTALIAGGLAAAGGIGGAAINAHAAGKAAGAQTSAANYAADLQKQEADNALAFQEKQWDTQQKNLAPWLQSGKGALSNLTGLLKTPGQGLLTPWTSTFTAPTDVTEQNDPGYQFRLQQGEKALQNSAAARGDLLSGNTLTAASRYGQDYASNEYGNVYNRAMQEFQQRYGIFENNQTNDFNRLAALAGVGQTTATTLGQEGQQAANNIGQIDLTTGAQQGQQINNAAAATASGYVGGANAWGGALGGTTNSLSQLMMMNQLFGGGGGVNPTAGIDLGSVPNPGLSNPAYYGIG